MKHVVREIVSRGEFPWWNPYIASGQPMAANPAYEIFYPPQWLIFLGPFTFGFALHVLVHVYLAAIGAFLFFRSMPLRRDASVFGALSFALSGFFLGTATNLPTFFVWSWAGLVGWTALRVVRGGSIALPSIIFAMPILVGEPVSLLQLFGLMFVVAGLKSARRLAMTVAIALLIAAVQLVPAVDHARDSIRSRGLIYKTVADFSLPPARAIELIAPFAIPPVHAPGQQRTHYFLTLYCGVATLILFVAGIATRQRRWLMVTVIALLSYLLALGDATPLLRVLYACGIRFIRYPEKFIAIGIVTMIGFAAEAANRLLEGDAKLRRAVIIGGIAVTLIALISPAAAIIAAAWTIVLWRVGTNRAWHLVVIALLLIDLGIVANRVMPRHPSRFFTPPDAANAFAAPRDGYAVFHRGEWAHPDLAARYDAFSPALNTRNALRPYSPAAWGIRTALEYDFDETDLLPTHDLLDSMQRLGNSGFVRWSEPFMQLSNVHYVIDYDPRGSIQSPIVIRRVPSQGRYWFAQALLPMSEFERSIRGPMPNGLAFTDPAFTPAPAAITNVAESSHSADIDVDATGRSFLVATITRHKYWRATIDGQPTPLVAANVAYQGLVVPAGHHHITLRYRNPVVAIGGIISALALLAVLWYALAAGFIRPLPRDEIRKRYNLLPLPMYLLIAHPGHELLLHGWISRNKPVVHVLTDGAAHSSGRLASTADFLRDAGARAGAIFGRLSDREAYEMILERNTALLFSLVGELADDLERNQPSILVSDSAEGYNPVHDLCRLVAGAAIAMAGVATKQYEYAVVNHPRSFDTASIEIDLDDAEYAAKMERARRQAGAVIDIEDLLKKYGADAYRREAFRLVVDWAAIDENAPPLYERFGEERVAAHRYANVIRRREHMLPLRDALCAEVEKRSCAF